MSNDDKKKLLGGLFENEINSLKDQPKKAPAKAHTEEKHSSTGGAGLSSLDILNLPTDQRKIINLLSRKRQLTFDEIQQELKQNPDDVRIVMDQLKAANYIYEAIVDGQITYRVVFRAAPRRKASGLLGELWAKVDVDKGTFLRGLSLFDGLNDFAIDEVAEKLHERHYAKDEVILWQGDVSEYIYFVKTGVVGISRLAGQNQEKKSLAFLKPGDIMGEYSILLTQGGAASATATATIPSSIFMIKKADFLTLMNKYPSIALELARILVHRLVETNSRLTNVAGTKVVLVIGIGPNVGRTTLSATLAMTLAHVTKKSTAYTQQPSPASLVSIFNIEPGKQTHKHTAGFDLMLQQEAAGVPMTARATLALDRLVTQYENAIISLSHDAEELIDYFAAHADQIIFVLTPEPEKWEELNAAQARLRSLIRPEKVGLFVVVNRTRPEHATMRTMGRADFDLPYESKLTPLATMTMDSRSAAIAAMTNAIADRLGRANQVSLFIPTTVDVDKAVDTSIYVQRTLEFLGSRFGGATTNEARGVWNSADSGLVGETIHIVKSYATQHDLDTHLQEILNYVEQMKAELKQEAMAVEINQKLMLI